MISENVKRIQSHLQGQTIVAVTKTVGTEEIVELLACGIVDIAENRDSAFLQKQEILKDYHIIWHFIGHLQTNKVKKVINKISYLHSLDRESLAIEIQKQREKPLDCFVEVNISGEESKTGMSPKEVKSFIINCEKYDKIRVVGLMGMARLGASDEETLKEFQFLKSLQLEIKELNLAYAPVDFLSMGMSQDYQIAIQAGSTHLRLGTILFRKEDSR